MSNSVEIVIRSVNERTTRFAFALAKKHINPVKIHTIHEKRPFIEAVKAMMQIDYNSNYIVFLDADCLITQDMRSFLAEITAPYIDCYVFDKFRGKIHAGVHITRYDVVERMKKIFIELDNKQMVLKPESTLRDMALEQMNLTKSYRQFFIFHDFFQDYHHIFIKYALRELRSRNEFQRTRLHVAMQQWNNNLDFRVAKQAINYSRIIVPDNASPKFLQDYIEQLPELAETVLGELNIRKKRKLIYREIPDLVKKFPDSTSFYKPRKVFGIGLSRTGTKSLTVALNMLGINAVHYPTDATTIRELLNGHYRLWRLEHVDSITDITASAFYKEFDQLYSNSKFILTIRDKEEWLDSLQAYWADRPPYSDPKQTETHMQLRRLLRKKVYGMFTFDRQKMSEAYDRYHHEVRQYFSQRPDDLLEINIPAGQGWSYLCPFLDLPVPCVSFPNINTGAELAEIARKHNLELSDIA